MNFKIFNKKDSKKILKQISEQYGISSLELDYGLIEKKEKIYLISKDLSKINYENMKLNNLGLYFCKFEGDGIRLSIEGAQLIGKNARKKIILNEEETKRWLAGEELEKKGAGYVIVKNKIDILGCGKISNNKLYNYTPKERRINVL